MRWKETKAPIRHIPTGIEGTPVWHEWLNRYGEITERQVEIDGKMHTFVPEEWEIVSKKRANFWHWPRDFFRACRFIFNMWWYGDPWSNREW